jgi:hypothetical protein
MIKISMAAGFIKYGVFNLNHSEAMKRFSLAAGFIKTSRRFL